MYKICIAKWGLWRQRLSISFTQLAVLPALPADLQQHKYLVSIWQSFGFKPAVSRLYKASSRTAMLKVEPQQMLICHFMGLFWANAFPKSGMDQANDADALAIDLDADVIHSGQPELQDSFVLPETVVHHGHGALPTQRHLACLNDPIWLLVFFRSA